MTLIVLQEPLESECINNHSIQKNNQTQTRVQNSYFCPITECWLKKKIEPASGSGPSLFSDDSGLFWHLVSRSGERWVTIQARDFETALQLKRDICRAYERQSRSYKIRKVTTKC